MTQREKEWVQKIQLLQLQSNNPDVDDYYYQVKISFIADLRSTILKCVKALVQVVYSLPIMCQSLLNLVNLQANEIGPRSQLS